MRLCVLAITILMLLTGCNDQDSLPIKTSLVLKDTFSQESRSFTQGETITFYLTATNTTNDTVVLNFSSSQVYDFYIVNDNGDEVWRWSEDKLFLSVLSSNSFLAGETKTFSTTWDQKLATSENIQIGNYTAHGTLLDQSESANFTFNIQ